MGDAGSVGCCWMLEGDAVLLGVVGCHRMVLDVV